MNLCLHEFQLNKTALRRITFQLLKCFLYTQESPLCYLRQTAVLVFSDALRPFQVLFVGEIDLFRNAGLDKVGCHAHVGSRSAAHQNSSH
jgi:hypothetical protein